ncbi:MAG: TolC family protein [Ignavibacteriota bacterium]|nr:TolC family protein [Ignavibacteriota bacterium]MCO6447061.1 TolC family protein [Ignavibacterium album]QKJ98584.1 MAG: TolC family protein [Ignavibacteriota bacterium]
MEGIKRQAGLLPNPEADLEIENILGGKELNGFTGAEYTLSASYLFELGGKRNNRVNLVNEEINSAKSNYELLKLDVISQVKKAFIELVKIQHQIKLQHKFVNLNEEILKIISERVKAGKTSPAEESKEKFALMNSRLELQRFQRDYLSTQTKINSLCGTSGKNFVPSSDLFDALISPPNKEEIFHEIENIPSIKYLNNETNIRKAQLELEESNSVPDLTASLGIRYLNELKTNSFVAGLSMPLPFFNRNQGNIQSAEIKVRQMEELINAQKLSIIESLTASFNNLVIAYNNAVQFNENILSESENAYEITSKGYLQGRFAFIDMLDAQRTLFDTQAQYLLELSEYYNSIIEIENLTGKNFLMIN